MFEIFDTEPCLITVFVRGDLKNSVIECRRVRATIATERSRVSRVRSNSRSHKITVPLARGDIRKGGTYSFALCIVAMLQKKKKNLHLRTELRERPAY